MKKLLSVLLVLTLLLGLCACGSSGNYKTEAAAPAMAENTAMEESAADTAYGLQDSGQPSQAELPENRKWVVTVYLDSETDDLDAMMEELNQQIRNAGGYVENQNVYNGSTRNSYRYRNASLTIRIPAEEVDFFVSEVSAFSNVISQELNKEDITLTYVATQSRLAALETEQARLLELLAQAETMEDLLTIEARLTDVRYELENAATQMRLYDNQVDYATIHLSIQEVKEYTPVKEPSVWERISTGFRATLENLSESFVDLFVWIAVNSPNLVVWGILIFLAAKLAKKLRKGRTGEKKPWKLWKRKKNHAPKEFPSEET